MNAPGCTHSGFQLTVCPGLAGAIAEGRKVHTSVGVCAVVAAVAIAGLGGCMWSVPYSVDPTSRSGEPESGLNVDFAGTKVQGTSMSWLDGRVVVRNVSTRVIVWDPNALTVLGDGCNLRTSSPFVKCKGADHATSVNDPIELLPGESCALAFELQNYGLGACVRVHRHGHSVPERLLVDLGEATVGGEGVSIGRFELRPTE